MSLPSFLRRKIDDTPFTELVPPPTKIHYLTFATTWPKAIARAEERGGYIRDRLDFFSSIDVRTEKDLPQHWFDTVSAVGLGYGYGYWSWKPLIVADSLAKIPDGDVLLYLDGGCKFPQQDDKLINALSRISRFITSMIDQGIDLGMTTYPSIWFNTPRCSTSLDILRFFELENDLRFIDHFPHWEAGTLLIRTSRAMRALVFCWRDTMLRHLRELFAHPDDGLPGFVHNSADQSVLQCILYRNKTRIANTNSIFYDCGIYARERG